MIQLSGWPLLLPPICLSLFRSEGIADHQPPPFPTPHRRPRLAQWLLRRGVLRLLAGSTGSAFVHVVAADGYPALLQRGVRVPPRRAPVHPVLHQRSRAPHRRPGGARRRAVVGEPGGGEFQGVLNWVLRVHCCRGDDKARGAAHQGRHVEVREPERAVMGAAGTMVCLLGMAVMGDFQAMPREAEGSWA